MAVPATNGELRKNIDELEIGDYIPCHYRAPVSGSGGYFYGMGQELKDEITSSNLVTPDGKFYFVKVADGILISDRIVQNSISWDNLNSSKLIEGDNPKKSVRFRKASNSYSYIPHNSLLAPTSTGMTFKMTLKRESWEVSSNEFMMSKLQSGGFGFWVTPGGNLAFTVRIASSTDRSFSIPIADIGLKPNEEVTVMASYDGIVTKMYINGVLVISQDWGSFRNIYYSYNNAMFLGCEAGSGTSPDSSKPYYAKVEISEYAFWNRALTDEEVMIYSKQELLGNESDIQGVWNMNDIAGTTIYNRVIGMPDAVIRNSDIITIDNMQFRSPKGGITYINAYGGTSITDLGLGVFPPNNEWDKYIVDFPKGRIKSGMTLDDIWHWSDIHSICQETTMLGLTYSGTAVTSANRVKRGNSSIDTFDGGSTSSASAESLGFRPVLQYREV
jgi:Concanavalin A-like lectin/glucanases superfamily